MATAPKNPLSRDAKRELATAHIRASYDFAATCPLPPGVTRAEAIEQIKDWVAYEPGAMDPRFGRLDKSYGGRR